MQRVIMVVLLLLALSFTVLPAVGGDDVYIVKPGDTLSGIALKLYGDAKKWPALLEANPQVTDPALIFPGDSLSMTPAGEAIAISSGTEAEPFTEYEPLPVSSPEAEASPEAVPMPADLPVEVVKPALAVSGPIYRSAGYITTDLPQGSVVGAFESKHSHVEGDEIIVDLPADEGTAFTILRPMQQVYHPDSGEYLGWVVRVVGWAEVTCRREGSSQARLVSTLDAVNIGDRVAPFDPQDVLENDIIDRRPSTFCLEDQGTGHIVAAQESSLKVTIGAGDIVFLDTGRNAGVEAGDQFSVYRNVDPGSSWELGVLQVLRVGEKTSTALVVRSHREIAILDLVQPRSISEEVASGS